MLKIILSVLLVACCAAPALAADATIGGALVGLLHGDVVPIISAFLTALISIVLNKVRVKYNLDISAERQKQLEALALQGVALAEEKAAALIKSGTATMNGQSKLNLAIAHIIGVVPAVSVEQADALVHAALAKTTGAGATGAQAV